MCADIVELIGAFPVVLCNVYQKTTLARKWFNTNVSLGVIKYVKIQQFARFHMFIEQHATLIVMSEENVHCVSRIYSGLWELTNQSRLGFSWKGP